MHRAVFVITTFALTVIAIACVGVETAQAADTCTWTGTTNADWKTGSNWTGTGCTGTNGPPAGSTLIFPSGASNLSTTNNIGTGDTFAITISGSGYTLAGDSIDVTGFTDSDTSGSNTISLNIAMTAASTFTVTNAAETLTISGVISGAYALTKAGSGVLVLSGTNTYGSTTLNPETTISAGTLQISKDANLGTAPTTAEAASLTFKGGTLATTATFTLTTDRGMTFTSTGTIDVASGTTLTYGGVATGAGGLTMTDSGTLVLSGTSTYTGDTTLDGGTVSISKDTDLGKAPTTATAGSITFNGGTLEVTAGFTLTADRGIAFTQNGAIDVSTGTLVYDGIATGTGTGFTLSGAGTLELEGANTYTGPTVVSAGTLEVGGTNTIPSSSDVTVTGTLNMDGKSDAIGSLAGTGTVTNTTGTTTLTTNGDNASTAFSGVIEETGTDALSLTKTGTGTLTLSGTNTYTGDTTIDAGTVSISADDNLGKAPTTATAASITFDGGTLATTATFTLTTDRGMTFTSTGTIDVASGTTLTYGGVATGAGGLTMTDSGTLVLSGTNTYTGITTLDGGTVSISKDTDLGKAPTTATAGSITFNGGTLEVTAGFTLTADRGIAFTQNGAIDVSTGTLVYDGIATGTGTGFTLSGAGTLELEGTNTYTGPTVISSGSTLELDATNTVPSNSDVTVTGTLNMDGHSDTIGSLAGTGTVTNTTGTTTLTTNGDNASTAFSGVIEETGTDALSLTKTGTGTLTLSGTNTYTGDTTIDAGTVSISADDNLGKAPTTVTAASITFDGGTLATTATFTLTTDRGMTFTSTGTIDVASGATLTYGGVAAGAGGLTMTDSGTLVLSGTNTYTGITTLDGGTLSISADDNLGKAPTTATAGSITFDGGALATTATFTLTADRGIAFTATGTIDVAPGTTLTYGGIAAGAGGLTTNGAGTLVLSGTNTYSGTTTISAGTLTVNGSQSASAVSLNGGTLDGTGSVGAIASTSSGGTLDPGNGSPGILTSGGLDLSTGSPTFSVQLNGTTAGTSYNQLSTGGTINLTGATLSASLGFTPANGEVFTIIDNTGSNAVTGTFSGLSEGSTITLGGWLFAISYVGGTGHSVTLTMGTPVLALVDSVSPSATGQNPGTNLTYTIAFTNNGNQPAVNTTITTAIPNSTDFEVGSVSSSLGTTGLSVSVAYSDDGGTTYTYTPVSGGGGAGAGYDRNVTNIQWTLTGSLSQTSPNNTGSVSFIARIR